MSDRTTNSPSTVYISIGNSDDRLTQAEWSEFCRDVDGLVRRYAEVHGAWYSLPSTKWQNACWCVAFEPRSSLKRSTMEELAVISKRYRQHSIAWAEAKTTFIEATDE
jgi:hypothetical protein